MSSGNMLLRVPAPDQYSEESGVFVPAELGLRFNLRPFVLPPAALPAKIYVPNDPEFVVPELDNLHNSSSHTPSVEPNKRICLALSGGNWSALRVASEPGSVIDQLGKTLQASNVVESHATMPKIAEAVSDFQAVPEQLISETDKVVSALLTSADTATGVKAARTATALIDASRFLTKQMQLPLHGTIESLIVAAENKKLVVTPQLWDAVARIDVPPLLAGDVLELMDKNNGLHHPLAFNLIALLPENHHFIASQQKRVAELKRLTTGSVETVLDPINMSKVWRQAQSIVSVFPVLPGDHKMGLDIEMWPSMTGVSVPPGCVMGQDCYGETMPELRLTANDETLVYDNAWRQRFFRIWLWQQTTEAKGQSTHIHTDRTGTDPLVYKRLFGSDKNDAKVQEKTIEVRSALADYDDVTSGSTQGFDTVHTAHLVDLLYALRTVKNELPAALGNTELPAAVQRLQAVLLTTSDPDVRAAAAVALTQQEGLRIVKPITPEIFAKSLLELEPTIVNLIEHLHALPGYCQQELLDAAFGQEDGEALFQIIYRAQYLSPEVQENLVSRVIASGDNIDVLFRQLTVLSPISRELLAKAIIDWKQSDALEYLLSDLEIFLPETRQQTVSLALNSPRPYRYLDLISAKLDTLPEDLVERAADMVLTHASYSDIANLYDHILILPPSCQQRLWQMTANDPDSRVIAKVVSQMSQLPLYMQKLACDLLEDSDNPEVQTGMCLAITDLDNTLQWQVIHQATNATNKYRLLNIAHSIHELSEQMQAAVGDAAISLQDKEVLELIIENIPHISEELEVDLVNHLVESKSPNLDSILKDSFASLRPESQKIIVEFILSDTSKQYLRQIDTDMVVAIEPDLLRRLYGLFSRDQHTRKAKKLALSSNLQDWKW